MKHTKNRRTFRRLRMAAASIILLFTMTITAFGYNPIKSFFEWAAGVVQVWGNPSGLMELSEVIPSEYHSLEEALEENGISNEGLPTWVPADYILADVDAQDAGGMQKYTAVYEGDRGEILIRVMKLVSSNWMTGEEKEAGGQIYQRKGIEYYLIANHDQYKIGWQIGPYAYMINGHLTENELKTMIDSIL